ncbi:serine/threonine protein kinase US3A [Testudinid alphaherpesvirus 3]|uniref:Serine/threonine protein kinase US3A n=1 Tax=Testudinid alphaherpesvirus 3 TaxID=2560801 RepID=A0A0M3MX67_9ALPH|nr:serine/threonine protein kinase US3A [Testudinid alphaherpesvirus 3]AKI81688.1 serine/threonine protein kinase US3A [Testudinid alphaherpesvirus 3]AKI81791.1 serine/threonine protein kinase US3A [Testudinid alphaherpesvirus 3]
MMYEPRCSSAILPPSRISDEEYLFGTERSIVHPAEVLEKYSFGKVLGRGGSACVYSCINLTAGVERAMKVIPTDKVKSSKVVDIELLIATNVRHPCVIESFTHMSYPNLSYLEMELLDCDLYSFIQLRGPCIPPHEVATIMFNVLEGVHYLHDNNIIHRDIKVENIFLSGIHKVKLGDFGLSVRVNDITELKPYGRCGTDSMRPPELLLNAPYAWPCDIWCCGMVLYELLTGNALFWKETPILDQMLETLEVNQYDLPSIIEFPQFKEVLDRVPNTRDYSIIYPEIEILSIPESAKKMICRMVRFNQLKRPSARKCQSYPFMEYRVIGSSEIKGSGVH